MFYSHCLILMVEIIFIVLLLHNVSFPLLYSRGKDCCFIAPYLFHSHCFILVVKFVIVLLLHNVSFPLLYSSDQDCYCFIAPQHVSFPLLYSSYQDCCFIAPQYFIPIALF